MNIKEYEHIFKVEGKHFYYQAMHYNVLSLLLKYSSSKKGLKILDAGCGTGFLTKKLSKYGQVYGIDNSLEALKFSKLRGVKNLKKGSITALPFGKNSFDVVVCIDVLYHQKVENDAKAFSEFYRILKPNGILIIKVPAHKYLSGNHDQLVHTKRRYEKSEVKTKLTRANFNPELISYGHLLLLPALLIKKLTERFFNSNESYVKMPSNIVNDLLASISKFETMVMLDFGLPNGISIYAVASRSEE